MKERRRYKRLAIKTPIIWQQEGHKKENLADALLFNITKDGLFLKTNLRPKIGSYVKLKLILAKGSKPISLKGKIIWAAKKREHPYLYPGIGIKFEHLLQDEYKRLNAFIQHKLTNFRDANELKNMYIRLKDMASRLVELEERHSSATHFKKVLDNAISEIDDVAHLLDREINEIKRM